MEQIKICAVGNGAVGKTCLLMTYAMNVFPQEYVPTVFDNYATNVLVDGRLVSVGLMDTAGQDEYDRIRPLGYSDVNVFLICYSVIDRVSFDAVKTKWEPEVRHYLPHAPKVLVGTKLDQRTDSQILDGYINKIVMTTEGETMKEMLGCQVFREVSAYKREGLKELFEDSIRASWGKLNPVKKMKKKERYKCHLL